MNDIAQKPTNEQPVTASPEKPEIDPNAGKPWWNATLRFVSQRLLNLAVLTALVSISGFFVVHSYLDKITGIFTYNIAAVVYVSAGANMVAGSVIIVIIILWPWPLIGAALGVLLGFLTLILRRLRKRLKWLQSVIDRIDPILKKRVYPALQFVLSLNNILTLVLLTVVISLIAIDYGRHYYEVMPRFLGGAESASVVLVFKPQSGIQIGDLGLPIEMQPVPVTTGTPAPALRSQPVEMLMELSDGILVRDPRRGIPVVIKNDLLYAIIDAEPPPFSSVATATLAPLLTATETPTITPMPSP